jgi:hypothetical protein
MDNVLREVVRVEGAWFHDHGGNTRVRKPNTPSIQGHVEETLDGRLTVQLNLEIGVLNKWNLILGYLW